jgi:hypothetical protein
VQMMFQKVTVALPEGVAAPLRKVC